MYYSKHLPLFLFALSMVVIGRSQSPNNGLIAYYPFDQDPASGNARFIEDASPNNNHGDYRGSIDYVVDRFGVDCGALSFNGGSYISVPNSSSLSSPSNHFTAAVWVKIGIGADFFTEWLTILCKSNSFVETDASPHYRMQATAQTVSLNTAFTEEFVPQLSYDTWYFYAYVYDGRRVSVYLDGQLVFTFNYSGNLQSNTMPLEIGRDRPGKEEYFNGALDDLRIYNRALRKDEIEQLYRDNSGAGQVSPCQQGTDTILPLKIPIPMVDYVPGAVIEISPDDDIYQDEKKEQEELVTTPVDEKPDIAPEDRGETSTIIPPSANPTYKDLPQIIDEVPVEYQRTITVKSTNLKIYPYDNEKEDGDIVSININGVWVRDRFLLKKKKPTPAPGDYIRFTLNSQQDNYIVSKAWNLGEIPPNTLTIAIDDGTSIQEVIINSEIGKSGGIRIVTE
ncbi:MAG: LamG domain-containing protein [Verrucomicrobiota bacterium]